MRQTPSKGEMGRDGLQGPGPGSSTPAWKALMECVTVIINIDHGFWWINEHSWMGFLARGTALGPTAPNQTYLKCRLPKKGSGKHTVISQWVSREGAVQWLCRPGQSRLSQERRQEAFCPVEEAP